VVKVQPKINHQGARARRRKRIGKNKKQKTKNKKQKTKNKKQKTNVFRGLETGKTEGWRGNG
jgi:hypothetical protein